MGSTEPEPPTLPVEPEVEAAIVPRARLEASHPPAFQARMFAPIVAYVEKHHGPEQVARLLDRADLAADTFETGRKGAGLAWLSALQAEQFLADAYELLGDEASFRRACTYKLASSYGPLRFILRAASPAAVFRQAIRNFHMVSRVSRYEASFPSANTAVAHYTSDISESRLLCISRQAHIAELPRIWDLPPAHVVESECIARGHGRCTYHVRWYTPRGFLPPAAGAAAGAAAGLAATIAGLSTLSSLWALPLMGLLIGELAAQWTRNRKNLAVGEAITEELAGLIVEHEQARAEILDLTERQRSWARMLEARVRDRTRQLEEMVRQLETIGRHRDAAVRGVSHDLRNPLAVLRMTTQILADTVDDGDAETREIVELHRSSVEQLGALVESLIQRATTALESTSPAPTTLRLAPMVAQVDRRLRALAHGKGLRTSCFHTREMPEAIRCHPVLFDRVVDNLLTNAVKHTSRGSVVVEFDGRPGYLVLKVSDSGRGIPQEEIARIFERRTALDDHDAPHGIGMSVVVELLDALGGKLEVMSKVGAGTTFWVHFPVEPTPRGGEAAPETVPSEKDRTARVVVIRPPPPPEHLPPLP